MLITSNLIEMCHLLSLFEGDTEADNVSILFISFLLSLKKMISIKQLIKPLLGELAL